MEVMSEDIKSKRSENGADREWNNAQTQIDLANRSENGF